MGKRNVYLERLYEGSTVDCEPTIEDVVEAIIEEYKANEVGLCDILGTTCINGLSVEDVVTVYSTVYKIIEDDTVIRISEGERILL